MKAVSHQTCTLSEVSPVLVRNTVHVQSVASTKIAKREKRYSGSINGSVEMFYYSSKQYKLQLDWLVVSLVLAS